MSLARIGSLQEFDKILDTKFNEGFDNSIVTTWRSRKFILKDNEQVNMQEILTRFHELAETDNDPNKRQIIENIEWKLKTLDLRGELKIRSLGTIAKSIRIVKRLFTDHDKIIKEVVRNHVLNDREVQKAGDDLISRIQTSKNKNETIKEFINQLTFSEENKNIIRYITQKDPKIALDLALCFFETKGPQDVILLGENQSDQELDQLFHQLLTEMIPVTEEYLEACLSHFKKAQNILNDYEKSPTTCLDNLLINYRKNAAALSDLRYSNPAVVLEILKQLDEKLPADFDPLQKMFIKDTIKYLQETLKPLH